MPTNPPHLRPPEISSRAFLKHYAEWKRRRGEPVFCFQVGANDGRINDPVYPYLTGSGWSGLLVEPQVEVFENELTATYADYPKVALANVALAATKGELPFYRVAISKSRWATGLAGFRKDNILHHIDIGYIAKMAAEEGVALPSDPAAIIETISVPTMTVQELLDSRGVDHFDLLCIDTEGFDLDILRLVDFDRYRPEVVLFESKNLNDAGYVEAKSILSSRGYALYWDNGDTLGSLAPFSHEQFLRRKDQPTFLRRLARRLSTPLKRIVGS